MKVGLVGYKKRLSMFQGRNVYIEEEHAERQDKEAYD